MSSESSLSTTNKESRTMTFRGEMNDVNDNKIEQ